MFRVDGAWAPGALCRDRVSSGRQGEGLQADGRDETNRKSEVGLKGKADLEGGHGHTEGMGIGLRVEKRSAGQVQVTSACRKESQRTGTHSSLVTALPFSPSHSAVMAVML